MGLSASVRREDNSCRQCQGSRVHDYDIGTESKKNFSCYHFRSGIETKVDVMVEPFSSSKWAQNMLQHLVTVCDALKVVMLVGLGGVTFVHPRLRRLWWCDVFPP